MDGYGGGAYVGENGRRLGRKRDESDEWEILPENLRLYRNEQLGCGAFGKEIEHVMEKSVFYLMNVTLGFGKSLKQTARLSLYCFSYCLQRTIGWEKCVER